VTACTGDGSKQFRCRHQSYVFSLCRLHRPLIFSILWVCLQERRSQSLTLSLMIAVYARVFCLDAVLTIFFLPLYVCCSNYRYTSDFASPVTPCHPLSLNPQEWEEVIYLANMMFHHQTCLIQVLLCKTYHTTKTEQMLSCCDKAIKGETEAGR